jgi:hypothetical protein
MTKAFRYGLRVGVLEVLIGLAGGQFYSRRSE